jgi:hypothetical protein
MGTFVRTVAAWQHRSGDCCGRIYFDFGICARIDGHEKSRRSKNNQRHSAFARAFHTLKGQLAMTSPIETPNRSKPAAIEFGSIDLFRRMSQEEGGQRTRQMGQAVCNSFAIAAEFMARDKEELLNLLRERPNLAADCLTDFPKAHRSARAIAETIGSAEARLHVILAMIGGGDQESAVV